MNELSVIRVKTDQLLGLSQLSTLLSALLRSFGTAVIDGTSKRHHIIDQPHRFAEEMRAPMARVFAHKKRK